jgi:hypothetical protein
LYIEKDKENEMPPYQRNIERAMMIRKVFIEAEPAVFSWLWPKANLLNIMV